MRDVAGLRRTEKSNGGAVKSDVCVSDKSVEDALQPREAGRILESRKTCIRRGRMSDLAALRFIYNYEVEHGVATLDLTPRSIEDRAAWFEAHQSEVHPLYVAEVGGEVAGYATLSPYRSKEAYRSTVELSVYVGKRFRGRGLASALMCTLLDHARACADIHLVVSVITGGNAASVHLHEKLGFSYVGTLHQVGLKGGAYQDIFMYELLV